MTNPMQRTDLSPVASDIANRMGEMFSALVDAMGGTEAAYDLAIDVMQTHAEERRALPYVYEPPRRTPEEEVKIAIFIAGSTPCRIEDLERHLGIDCSGPVSKDRPNHARMTAIEIRLGMMITEDLHPLGTRLRLAEKQAFGQERHR